MNLFQTERADHNDILIEFRRHKFHLWGKGGHHPGSKFNL
jgi:hypothetical protein